MTTPSPDAARSAYHHRTDAEVRYACTYPELSLRVWATPEGMRIQALVYMPGERYQRALVIVQDAVWQPREVTEVSVVDWGRRALAAWLERQLLGTE